MSSLKTRLSELLVAKKLITKERLAPILADAETAGINFTRLLVERRLVTAEALVGLLAEELHIPTLSLAKYRVDPSVARLIPERVARQYVVIPMSRFGKRVVVAMADPLNLVALEDLKMLTQYDVDPVLAQEHEIRQAIAAAYETSSSFADADQETAMGDGRQTAEAAAEPEAVDSAVQLLLLEEGGEAPVVKALNLMIVDALRRRASDIHLEPMEHAMRVRYRIDGQLKEAYQLPKAAQSTLLTRLKIMAGMDITEWRLPQDGRFKVRLDAREVDFRVSLLPITHGGKVVLRALDKDNLSIGLDHLGFLPDSIKTFKEIVARPHGMILVTGPTGSGKSTTLYSILSQLNDPARSIVTIEDPVEYQVEGITQVPVNPEIGLTFAAGLRSILRQNPDIVMVGEIRDFETADIAMKASLTGHLVLSTLHTNDTASAVTRLVDMGVEPFLVASSVVLIEAQRLVRKLCAKCRQPDAPPAELLKRLEHAPEAGTTFYRAVGCRTCRNTGYLGRFGLIEVLVVDEHVRELVIGKVPSWEIKQYATEHLGMTTLRIDGLKKAAAGLTTLEEVVQVTSEE